MVDTTVVEPKTVAPTVKDVLVRAADLLEEFGWAQEDKVRFEKPGPFCATVAIQEALDDLGSEESNSNCLIKKSFLALGFSRPDISGSGAGVAIVKWNDAPGRTRDEVVARFRKAATESEEG